MAGPLGSTAELWRAQLPALHRAGYRALRINHRGHGGSAPIPTEGYRLEDAADDVTALLDELEIPQVHFVGSSLGGQMAMQLALSHPERVADLVLCSTSSRMGPSGAWRERAGAVREHGLNHVAAAVARRWISPQFAAEHPECLVWIQNMIASTPVSAYAAACELLERADLTASTGLIRQPALVLAGSDDLALPLAHSQRLADALANATLRVFPDRAHQLNVESPDEFNAVLLEHVARHPLR